ncbi:hypothetical protein [Actinomycetospora atypica]|uniref:GTPase n=1 Tax=Actinomycetospora atypica TaxID=1290095 RepID=A0ABV9YG61_9PSEU
MSTALPDEVAAARRGLDRALADRGAPSSPASPADGSGGAPVVAVVGAPGRGRRALVGALLDLDPDPGPDRFTDEPGGVPLLEELDLLLPRRTRDGAWDPGPASMLLVVVGAGAPLDRDELDRLAAVAGEVETVVFALVGTEAHRGWRTVLEADRDLVAEHVPRLAGAEWFPVSPVLARAARGTGPEGEQRRRAAGIAPLQRRLHQLVARRRRMLDEANALRAGVTALSGTRPGTDRGRRRTELEIARTSLRREHHVRWRAELAGARVAAVDDLGRRIRALGARHRERIDTASRAGLADLGPEVARDLTAVAEAVVAELGERLRRLVGGTLAGLLSPAELARLRLPAPEARPDVPVPAPRAPDRLLVVAGASGGLGLSRLALLPLLAVPVAPVVGAALVPVSVGIGLGAATWLARARRRAAERAHARTWLAEALGQARTDLERVLVDALIVADREITLALDRALDERGRALDAELSALAEQDRRDRAREVRTAEAVARAEAVLARLAHVRDTT